MRIRDAFNRDARNRTLSDRDRSTRLSMIERILFSFVFSQHTVHRITGNPRHDAFLQAADGRRESAARLGRAHFSGRRGRECR